MELEVRVFVAPAIFPANGLWFDLPLNENTIRTRLQNTGKLFGLSWNEPIIISDYEAPFAVDAYASIRELNILIDTLRAIKSSDVFFDAMVSGDLKAAGVDLSVFDYKQYFRTLN
ncbi:hypothetical protein H9L19_04765 [Weissella diestrammenae]|uniref:Uncharacterized protein n=1 Tax=Weissella diestrammenae TaxID=1162633 RepID=A0A7G9T3R1_9LACO|nr:antirestriction protein ArdA [Weissella diestrammenae]MCM0582718.1 hypothetical protein [Weissella diestrammenae]QNN74736.1 hypothetical protein H9L19_04765 [Weissella diestrammenae]